jgi:hypothetical protein
LDDIDSFEKCLNWLFRSDSEEKQGWIFHFIPKYCIWETFHILKCSGKSFLLLKGNPWQYLVTTSLGHFSYLSIQ